METYTISEAARLSGLSQKSIRNRVDRGQLRAVKRDGLRRIPRSEMRRAGLLRGSEEASEPAAESDTVELRMATEPLLGQLLDRLERQAERLGEYRALSRHAESLRDERNQLQAAVREALADASRAEARAAQAEAERVRARLGYGVRVGSMAQRLALTLADRIGASAERPRGRKRQREST